MTYDPEADEYICSNGRKLKAIYDRHSKNQNGYVSTVTVYECESCQGCPIKTNVSMATTARLQWKNETNV